ncbi:MAG: hypothetical protein ACHQIG_02325 [Acidimicrobiia bacterium]
MPEPPGPMFWLRAGVLVAARPRLWTTAIHQAHRLARPRWWSRAPFLPMPDADYLRFRFETQYGATPPEVRDVVAYLEWCRAMEHAVDRAGDKTTAPGTDRR